jgi:hypothetical protein
VIDDPLKPEDASSEGQRHAANQWCDHPIQPAERHADRRHCANHAPLAGEPPSDVTRGAISPGWTEPREVVRLPAIADDEEPHRVETVFGRQSVGR